MKNSIVALNKRYLSYWQLALILSSGIGFVSMILGGRLAHNYGCGRAVTSVLIGNLVLWVIGLGIISMTEQRKHSIENIKGFLGKYSANIAAIIIVTSFLIWYALQLSAPFSVMSKLIGQSSIWVEYDFTHKFSAALGFLCALLCIGGIQSIKWINIICFPLLVLYMIYYLIVTPSYPCFANTWGVSFTGIFLVILTWFPGMVNLSTFSRHAKSKADAFLALSLTTIFHILFQLFAIFGNVDSAVALLNAPSDWLHNILTVLFVSISFLCVNFLNTYWASVGWEVFFFYKQGPKGYAITGLIGTTIYIFFQSGASIAALEELGTLFMISLGVILLMSYMVKVLVNHRPRPLDKVCNSLCWAIGCLSGLIGFIYKVDIKFNILLCINSTILSFMVIMFIEEILWSIKTIKKGS